MAWTDADYARLRDELGHFGVADVYLWGYDYPPVRMRLDKLEVLVTRSDVGNPLLAAAAASGGDLPALEPDDDAGARWQNTMRRYDAVIGAMMLDPWIGFDDVPLDGDGRPSTRPVGGLCIYDLDWEQRMGLFDIGTGRGLQEDIRRFRSKYLSPPPRATGAGVAAAAEQPPAGPVPAGEPGPAPDVLVRRGDLVSGDDEPGDADRVGRGGGRGRAGRGAA